MNSALNASHVCLAKNWASFQKMKICVDELETHLVAVARGVAEDIIREKAGFQSEVGHLEKDRWLNVFPKALINFNLKTAVGRLAILRKLLL